jgi:EmrB/QacA subfamily drug resistance transporter
METDMGKNKIVLVIVASAFFMFSMDSTIVTTALPQIAVSFGVNPVRLSLVITSYVLSLAVFIPISGWVADRFGTRLAMQIAVAVFTASSLLCGISQGATELTAARILQGAGGALLIPVSRLVLLRSVPKSEFIKANAYMQIMAQLGPMMGPPVGGFLTTYVSWRLIFLINLPVGLLVMLASARFIDDLHEDGKRRLDWFGFLLSGVALPCILYGFDSVSRNANPVVTLALLGAGLAFGAAAIRHFLRHPTPLLDLSLFRFASFRVILWGGTLFRIAQGSCPFLFPLMFQVAFGRTAFASGLLTFSMASGVLVMRAGAVRLFRHFGFRKVMIVTQLALVLAVISAAFVTAMTPNVIIVFTLFVIGLCNGLLISALTTMPFSDVPQQRMSDASSLSWLMTQIGQIAGVASAAALLHFALSVHGAVRLTTADIHFAFIVIAAATTGALPFFALLPKNTGQEMSGHKSQ